MSPEEFLSIAESGGVDRFQVRPSLIYGWLRELIKLRKQNAALLKVFEAARDWHDACGNPDKEMKEAIKQAERVIEPTECKQ